jgi:hypothetical protein
MAELEEMAVEDATDSITEARDAMESRKWSVAVDKVCACAWCVTLCVCGCVGG